ncbi:MAG: TlpA family protein disulfide reductase [Candidatus Binatia bacterium]
MPHFQRPRSGLVAVLVLGGLFAAVLAARPALAETRPFGDLALTDLHGTRVSLGELKGRIVVLNFWATWCKPCVAEMPLLAGAAQLYRERGVVVVAASVDDLERHDEVEAFAGRLPEGMQVWVGATLEDMQRLGLGESLPVTAVLDREGKLVHQHRGVVDAPTLAGSIEGLLPAGRKKRLPGAVEAAADPSREPAAPEASAHPVDSPDASAVVPEHECDHDEGETPEAHDHSAAPQEKEDTGKPRAAVTSRVPS